MNDPTLSDYYEALQRLKDNRSINLPKGTKINNDTVAIEAGKKRGSIKKSRDRFYNLIEDIEKAKQFQNQPVSECEAKVEKYKRLHKEYREKYEHALNRELMLAEQLRELEKELEKIRPYIINNV